MDEADALERIDPGRAARRDRDRELVERVRTGEHQAFGQLYDEWFDRVYDVASRIVRQPDTAAEVTQEAFLSAWRKLDTLEDPAAFGGWVLRIARNGALNRTEREQRSRAVDQEGLAMIESAGAGASNAPSGFGVEDRLGRSATPGAALEDQEIAELVWQAAEALPERDIEVLDLQLRHGLTPAEIGEMLGLNRNAANQLVHRVRGRLATAIRARVLWRGGEPTCDVLTERLAQAGVESFGAEAVRVIERHVPGCTSCDERQRLRLEPVALFAALPIMAAPLVLKAQTATSLAALGVPMHGSAFIGSGVAGAVGMTSPAAQLGSAVHSGAGAHGGLGASVVQSSGATHLGSAVESLAPAHGPAPINLAAAPPIPPPITLTPKSAPITLGTKPAPIVLGVAAGVAVLLLIIGGIWFSHHGSGDDVATAGPVAFGSALATTTLDPSSPADPSASSSIVPFSHSGTIDLSGVTTTTTFGGGPSPIPPPPPGPPSSLGGPGPGPVTTQGGVVSPPESTPNSTTTPTDPAPTNPTSPTTPTTPPTTAATTTTTTHTPPRVSFTLSRTIENQPNWPLVNNPAASAAANPPILRWSVTGATGSTPFTVTITGPAIEKPSSTIAISSLSTSASGSYTVCPGTNRDPVKSYCVGAANGSYGYTLTIRGSDGTVWDAPLTRTLTVKA